MTFAPCFAASSMCRRCRSIIESLLPVQAVWTSAAFTVVIDPSPPPRLRTLAQLSREADELLLRKRRAADDVLHRVGGPRDRDRQARRCGGVPDPAGAAHDDAMYRVERVRRRRHAGR